MIDDGRGMFGRGHASPVVIHADAVVVWTLSESSKWTDDQ